MYLAIGDQCEIDVGEAIDAAHILVRFPGEGDVATYRENTFRHDRGSLVLRHGNRSLVDGNFFIDNSGGIRMYGDFHRIVNNYFQNCDGTGAQSTIVLSGGCTEGDTGNGSDCNRPDGVVIAWNTLVDNETHLVVGSRELPPKNCTIANNIIAGSSGTLVRFALTPINSTWAGNILSGSASTGDAPSSGFRKVDPNLEKSLDGVFRLAAGSPAIDSSAAVTGYDGPATDMDGQDRTGARDVGADERSDRPIIRRPLTRADVGPLAP